MGWNVNAALDHWRESAQPQSVGRCAQYTREAIEAGGVVLPRQASAKDYGASLRAAGFVQIRTGLLLNVTRVFSDNCDVRR